MLDSAVVPRAGSVTSGAGGLHYFGQRRMRVQVSWWARISTKLNWRSHRGIHGMVYETVSAWRGNVESHNPKFYEHQIM